MEISDLHIGELICPTKTENGIIIGIGIFGTLIALCVVVFLALFIIKKNGTKPVETFTDF